MALTTVEGLMMAIAAIVPHYLMGIAGGAGLMGMFMLVCGFFQPVGQLPNPVWRYPLHYMAFHSYAFAGERSGGPTLGRGQGRITLACDQCLSASPWSQQMLEKVAAGPGEVVLRARLQVWLIPWW
jgi:hypothetical protein